MQQPTFRGMSKETNEWVVGFGWHKTEDGALLYTDNGTVLCHANTMGKSTNTRDDNNIELFDGDVCLFTPMLIENATPFKGEIKWNRLVFAVSVLEEVPPKFAPPYLLNTLGVSVKKLGTVHD